MIPRHARESQRAYVERVLRAEGRLATYDVLYGLTYDDGPKCSITRLAAIICDLRHDGWQIATGDEAAALATYTLVAAPVTLARKPISPRLPLPEWVSGWRCADCNGRPVSQPETLLGNLARAFCRTCNGPRYFRSVA